jgi:hypothetical protein
VSRRRPLNPPHPASPAPQHHWAALGGHIGALQLLLENGASVNARDNKVGRGGRQGRLGEMAPGAANTGVNQFAAP